MSAVAARYRINPVPQGNITNNMLADQVAAIGGPNSVIRRINFPRFNVNAVVAILDEQQKTDFEAAHPTHVVRIDKLISRNQAPGQPSWGPPALAGSITAPADVMCCGELPSIYIVDTGVRSGHTAFATLPVALQPSFVANSLSTGEASAGVPADAYTDYGDHGTRMAGCFSGIDTGLLSDLGLSAKLVSVNCYDSMGAMLSNTTFASNAELAIFNTVTDHLSRISTTRYLRNHASVLLFAHSTSPVDGRIGTLDYAVQTAWEYGMTVVVSAGNDGVGAATVSPAGADWAITNGSAVVPYFYGSAPGGWNFQRANLSASRLLVAGAHTSANVGWVNGNRNTVSLNVVDLLAPGVAVTVPEGTSNIGYASGSGTSYSAAFTAATAAWVQTLRPWATPAQVRSQVLASSATTITLGGLVYPKLAVPSVTSLASVTMAYADWASHYLLPVAVAADLDPDKDGLANGIEYYCGLDPRYPDLDKGPSITFDRTAGTLTVKMPLACYLPTASGVTWVLEKSTDLTSGTWTTVATGALVQTSPCVEVGDGTEWKVTQAAVFTSQEFYRFHFDCP